MTFLGGLPGGFDPINAEMQMKAETKVDLNELDPLAKHGHRPKHQASFRHPSLEMKIIGGIVVVVAVAAIGAPVVF